MLRFRIVPCSSPLSFQLRRESSIRNTTSSSSSSNKTAKFKVPLDVEWSANVKKELKGKDPESLVWNTAEVSLMYLIWSRQTLARTDSPESLYQGIPVKPLYTKADVEGNGNEIPGKFPYTRGRWSWLFDATPFDLHALLFIMTNRTIWLNVYEQAMDDSSGFYLVFPNLIHSRAPYILSYIYFSTPVSVQLRRVTSFIEKTSRLDSRVSV